MTMSNWKFHYLSNISLFFGRLFSRICQRIFFQQLIGRHTINLMTPFYFYNLHIYLRKYFPFVSEFNLVWMRDLTNLLLVCALCWYLQNSICLRYQLPDTSCSHENNRQIPGLFPFSVSYPPNLVLSLQSSRIITTLSICLCLPNWITSFVLS